HGAVLGHRIRGRTDLGEQSRGRGGGNEIAASALDPLWDQNSGGPHVGHDVDLMEAFPLFIGGIQADPSAEARVGAVDVYGTKSVFGRGHQADDVFGARDVSGDSHRRAWDTFIQSRGELVNGMRVQVREHDL